MKNANRDRELDELIDEITTDANGEAEQLWAFRQAFEDNVAVPCEASIVGQVVQVLRFDYDGNERRGLTAVCRRTDGTKHVVAASELVISPTAQGGRAERAHQNKRGLQCTSSRFRRVPTVKLLLDTHILIWYLEGHPNLSEKHRSIIEDRRGCS